MVEFAKLDDRVAVLGEQVDNLVVQALVDVVAVGVLKIADGQHVLDHAELMTQREQLLLEFRQRLDVGHIRLILARGP